jgi:hypothetical protein
MRYANGPPSRRAIAEATTIVHEDMRTQLLQRLRGISCAKEAMESTSESGCNHCCGASLTG